MASRADELARITDTPSTCLSSFILGAPRPRTPSPIASAALPRLIALSAASSAPPASAVREGQTITSSENLGSSAMRRRRSACSRRSSFFSSDAESSLLAGGRFPSLSRL